jgi:hypothetical protein
MADDLRRAIAVEDAAERIRQERETFDQLKRQDARWFTVRLVAAWIAVLMLPVVFVTTVSIVLRHTAYPASVVTAASAALFVDVLGIAGTVWKGAFSRAPDRLAPVSHWGDAQPRGGPTSDLLP